jgi:hypothetical protein
MRRIQGIKFTRSQKRKRDARLLKKRRRNRVKGFFINKDTTPVLIYSGMSPRRKLKLYSLHLSQKRRGVVS